MNNISVSVVIPVYNNSKTLPPLLDALKSQTAAADEIIVVDDCSTDNSVKVASFYENVLVVRLDKNSGPSVARNKGIETATKDIIFFLDSDAVPSTNAVAVIKKSFENRPELIAMNGIMEKVPLNPGLFSRYKALMEYSWGKSIPQWDGSSKCLNARIGAMRRDAILKAGLFDPAYRKPSVEDHELGLRLTKHFPIVTNYELSAYHNFPGFLKTCKNYYGRTIEFLELMWSVPNQPSTDKGGASTKSALESILGTIAIFSLLFLIWGIWWIPMTAIILFCLTSAKSLKYHFRFGGSLFFLFSLGVHMIYSCIITIAALKTLLCFKLLKKRYGPAPSIISSIKKK